MPTYRQVRRFTTPATTQPFSRTSESESEFEIEVTADTVEELNETLQMLGIRKVIRRES
jgi:hypothetical protein